MLSHIASLPLLSFVLLAFLSSCSEKPSSTTSSPAEVDKIHVKTVVVSMFEYGEVTGDKAGEFQLWVENAKLDTVIDFPLGEYALRMNDQGVLGICIGGGIPNATASIMALGMDKRFDLSNAYWLIAGIAGGDPADMSLGSAAWAKHVVDGDLIYEIDGREIPENWPYGVIPLGGKEPADAPEDIYTGWTLDTIHFSLNETLAEWAFSLTKDLILQDGPGITEFRSQFADYPLGSKPPFVTMGDTLSASTYWHGALLNTWANDWIKLYAGTEANFMTSNMEDSGTLTALHRLGRLDMVDTDRILVLRTASNYTVPPTGKTASWSATAPYPDEGLPAIQNAYRVGFAVVNEIINNWNLYSTTIPGSDND